MNYYQQGDILLKEAELPVNGEKLPHLILLKSPTTGHEHKFAVGSAAILLRTEGGELYADVAEPAQLVHEEHLPITIPPGIWQFEQVREFDMELMEVRAVLD